jgi:hypothetical protein
MRLSLIALLLLSSTTFISTTFTSTTFASSTFTGTSRVVGAVYPIIERDALVAIKQKASQIDWQQAMSSYTSSWQTRQQSHLPAVTENQIRFHRPVHRLEQDIIDQHGTVIYPKGFAFNPLAFMKVPFRIVVLSVNQLDWFKPQLKKTDRILLTAGDVFKARDLLGKTVFLLDEKTRDKLNVTRVPTIIKQKGQLFELQEIKQDTP